MAGGGGGGQPTKSEVTQTNIPEYARPYVETMLGAGQQQIFNYETDPTTGEMTPTGIKPYQPFSQDPSKYFAGFSPMQEQSFQGAANLGVAPSNFAYMRLGADSLSICDSLSVITKKNGNKRAETLVVFPNPATHFLQIEQQEQGPSHPHQITNL